MASAGSGFCDRAEALEFRVELVYRDLLVKEVSGELESGEQEALPLIAEAYYHLSQLVQSMESLEPSRVQPPRLEDHVTTFHIISLTHWYRCTSLYRRFPR